MEAVKAWDRLFHFLDTTPVQPAAGRQAAEADDAPEVFTYAPLLEEILNKNRLVLGLTKEKRKILIELFDEDDPADYLPLTARAALSYRQGAWLRDYFRLDELASMATRPALQ